MAYDWKRFVKRITIQAPAKKIYTAWTTQQGLESWFLRLAEFTKPDGSIRPRISQVEAGDKYKWKWYGYDDSFTEESTVISTNGWDEFKFGFSGGCIVTISVKQEDGETICELVQQMPMEDENEQQYFFIECGKGWTFYMTNLKSILEGGPDLRNKNVNIQSVINA